MKKRALFVGVNNYDDESFEPLEGAQNDAKALRGLFEKEGFDVAPPLLDPTRYGLEDAVSAAVNGLGPGDFFLFFFAGHGFVNGGNELIFCKDDRLARLTEGKAGVSYDSLLAWTESGGFHRSFILDSCRSAYFTGIRTVVPQARRRDVRAETREPGAAPSSMGSITELHSCRRFAIAREIPGDGHGGGIVHGLYTKSLLDELNARVRSKGFSIGQDFHLSVWNRMKGIARSKGLTCGQMPTITITGEPPVIFEPVGGSAAGEPEARRPEGRLPSGGALEEFLYEMIRLYRPMLRESSDEHRKAAEAEQAVARGQEKAVADELDAFQASLYRLAGDDDGEDDRPPLDLDRLQALFEEVRARRQAYRRLYPRRKYFVEHRRQSVALKPPVAPDAPVVQALFQSVAENQTGRRRTR